MTAPTGTPTLDGAADMGRHGNRVITKVLIANRGEIARRVFRTARAQVLGRQRTARPTPVVERERGHRLG